MIILGIDPWLETIWFWVISQDWNDLTPQDFGIIKTSSKDDFPDRLCQIEEDIVSILKSYKPDLVAIERLFFGTNITNALSVAHARWVIIAQVAKRGIEILEFSPNEVKSLICGYWKAEKSQIQSMVVEHLSLNSIPEPDDAADALALAICWAFNS